MTNHFLSDDFNPHHLHQFIIGGKVLVPNTYSTQCSYWGLPWRSRELLYSWPFHSRPSHRWNRPSSLQNFTGNLPHILEVLNRWFSILFIKYWFKKTFLRYGKLRMLPSGVLLDQILGSYNLMLVRHLSNSYELCSCWGIFLITLSFIHTNL